MTLWHCKMSGSKTLHVVHWTGNSYANEPTYLQEYCFRYQNKHDICGAVISQQSQQSGEIYIADLPLYFEYPPVC